MEERFVRVKFNDYVKMCEEFNIEKSEFSFFVFEPLWESKLMLLGDSEISKIYDSIKDSFVNEMTKPKVIEINMRLFEIKKKLLEECNENTFNLNDESIYNYNLDDEDDYDLAIGPRNIRRR